jgi:hypothetical protein
MKSLKELTKMIIIKNGLGGREDLPFNLQKDLHGMEETRQVDSHSFQKVSSSMKSLKEHAKLAVLKLGLGDEECIPVTVLEELRSMEIGRGYQERNDGSGYHEFYQQKT